MKETDRESDMAETRRGGPKFARHIIVDWHCDNTQQILVPLEYFTRFRGEGGEEGGERRTVSCVSLTVTRFEGTVAAVAAAAVRLVLVLPPKPSCIGGSLVGTIVPTATGTDVGTTIVAADTLAGATADALCTPGKMENPRARSVPVTRSWA